MSKILWTQKQDIGPAPRVQHALAFDSAAGRTILFGGDSLDGTVFGDTWSWDGDNWTQVADIGPAARTGHALAYDSTRNRIVLFGGVVNGAPMHDTWEWSDDAWTQVEDTGPAPRSRHAMAFDLGRGRVVLFGGGPPSAAPLNDTWEWDGSSWAQQQDTGPSERRGHAMTFDTARARVVLFGGLGYPAPAALADTWEYDGVAGNWTQVADIGPEACFGAALVSKQSRVELYGGASALTFGGNPAPVVFGVTWEWDGALWTARQDIGPGPRIGHALAYDSARDRVVLFGGTPLPLDDTGAPAAVRGDTWEQVETGAQPGTGPIVAPPVGTGVALASFSIFPSVAVPGNTVVFNVVLIAPAGSAGQTVLITDPQNNPVLQVPVGPGAVTGQASMPLDPNLGATVTLPRVFDFVAVGGGVSILQQLIITP